MILKNFHLDNHIFRVCVCVCVRVMCKGLKNVIYRIKEKQGRLNFKHNAHFFLLALYSSCGKVNKLKTEKIK